ncbi:siderophore ABC transporter substrate-binding protein [Facklamia sp. 7083-14-GEN3]|uniref:siderophore ABC transporter substrate-binding protein n=1 Tax=Facklamia sp. 7083-14-GEN3 TaxID=2973478 RepID=UPI00215C3DEA|nr:ABC transporter substrate-binding protein [Facklamia sp. 7083-14-GEN3]MCR8968427.1 ABC transporter substrate-binding protein [Facklamia sp. 7083-14-GEN3]
MKKFVWEIVAILMLVTGLFVGLTTQAVLARETVTIEDIHGKQEVMVMPERVAALDNRTFATLADWDVKLVAAPKAIMSKDNPYVEDESIVDIGNHREPDFESLVAADPQVVIVGQRFASHYDTIKELLPEAVIIDFSWDVTQSGDKTGTNLINMLKESTRNLGQLFNKEKEADQLVADFDEAMAQVKEAYPTNAKVMGLITTGGEMGYSAAGTGRLWGPLFQIFNMQEALTLEKSGSNHQGEDISVEAIAQANPDILLVLDRDAALSSVDNAVPAQEIIEQAPALKEVTAVKEGHILYAPQDTYLNESIQTFTQLFKDMANMMATMK